MPPPPPRQRRGRRGPLLALEGEEGGREGETEEEEGCAAQLRERRGGDGGIEGYAALFLSGRDGCEWPVHYLTELRDFSPGRRQKPGLKVYF